MESGSVLPKLGRCFRKEVMEDASGLAGRAAEAQSLDLLPGLGNREPLQIPEHGSDSIRVVPGESQAEGTRLAPCTCYECPPEGRVASHFLGVTHSSVPDT